MAQPMLPIALPSLPPDEALNELRQLRGWLGVIAEERLPTARLDFARSVTTSVVESYWNAVVSTAGHPELPLRPPPHMLPSLVAGEHLRYAEYCRGLPIHRAFFEIGELLTTLLPDDYRSENGVFYTPPELVEALLMRLELHGTDWSTARVLDPSCGGAAFLAYVASRILESHRQLSPEGRLARLEEQLVGIELDPFAAWLSAVLVDLVAIPEIIAARRKPRELVHVGDALAANPASIGLFNVVVGNPPYGKVRLSTAQRTDFSRSLFGHANLYGLFTELAVRLTRPHGLVGFVTPTSFLGGEYFKRLRRLLTEEAPLVAASFIRDRDGVFAGVLQETMLAMFRRRAPRDRSRPPVTTELLQPDPAGRLECCALGRSRLSPDAEAPWLLPRSRSQAKLVRRLNRMTSRLSDYGYRVATGQLVWNRHKSQMRAAGGHNRFPIVWAEAINGDGTFEFRAEGRNHAPFIEVTPSQGFLVNYEPCVLVQRTTSKEQARRLIAAAVPNGFILEHGGYLVENHVNMVVPAVSSPAIPLGLLARLLNSRCVDEAFRCISGSVAVSAFELESLPLPAPDALQSLRGPGLHRKSAGFFEAVFAQLYHGR